MTCHKSIHATALNESETNKPPVAGKSRNLLTLCRRLLIPGGAEQSFIRWSSATRTNPLLLVLTKRVCPSCTGKTAVNSLPFHFRRFLDFFTAIKYRLLEPFVPFHRPKWTISHFPTLSSRGDSVYEWSGDAHPLAYGCKFRILGSLRVFWAKHHYI